MRRLLLVLVIVMCAASAGRGGWADSLFDESSHDFGSVPRGPAVTHYFHVTNRSGQAVHISNVRVSCGCTAAQALQSDFAPGESGDVIAQMDTRRFHGPKTVTIYVTFDRPQWDEVALQVHAYGRDDIAINPESFELGRVRHGERSSDRIQVTVYGNPDWEITSAKAASGYVKPDVHRVANDAGGASYEVTARLSDDTPVGKWYTDVWLNTTDPNTPRIQVPLSVEVTSALSVNPSVAELGRLKAGAEVERRVLVRGARPFKITRVEGADGPLVVSDTTPEAKSLHVLSVKLKPVHAGEFSRTVRVHTDLKGDNEVAFEANAEVVAK